jgi:hypothetical protein
MPKTDKPNILVIWGDDIGIANLSCYSHGLMGYQTPNIDRLAKEGMMFTDSYGEQSCTAGRSSFITGQSVYRTGLSKVGIPGAPIGMNEKIITIAAALKNQGYATGQFGKNHLGDLNSMLPTNHGFDEFDNWKVVFMEQRCPGTLRIWAEPFTKLRVPKLFNLRTDPYERADITSNSYYDWFLRRVFMIYGAQAAAAQWAATFKDFPPIQKPNTFTLDDALKAMHETAAGMH